MLPLGPASCDCPATPQRLNQDFCCQTTKPFRILRPMTSEPSAAGEPRLPTKANVGYRGEGAGAAHSPSVIGSEIVFQPTHIPYLPTRSAATILLEHV